MLRLSPTIIGLGRSDIQDYDRRPSLGPQESTYSSRQKLKNNLAISKQTKNIVCRPTTLKIHRLASQPFSSLGRTCEPYCNLQTHTSSDLIIQKSTTTRDLQLKASFKDELFENLIQNVSRDYSQRSLSFVPSLRLPLPHSKSSTASPVQYLAPRIASQIDLHYVNHNSSGLLFSHLPQKTISRSVKAPWNLVKSSISFDSGRPVVVSDQSPSLIYELLYNLPKKRILSEKIGFRFSQTSMADPEAPLTIESLGQTKKLNSLDSIVLFARPPLPSQFSINCRRVSAPVLLTNSIFLTSPERSFLRRYTDKGPSTMENDLNNDTQAEIISNNDQVANPNFLARRTYRKDSPEIPQPNNEIHLELALLTPTRSYRVYNDDISPATQPQTPANLPESRHRSRYHPFLTARVPKLRRKRRLTRLVGSAEISGGKINSTIGHHLSERNVSAVGQALNCVERPDYRRNTNSDEQNRIQSPSFNGIFANLREVHDLFSDDRSPGNT